MFTGITRGLCPVTIRERGPGFLKYSVTLPPDLTPGLEQGASVAVDGVCQTVVEINGAETTFDAIEETLSRTTLGELSDGSVVSIERSAKIGTELGGHLISGHVWGMAVVDEVRAAPSRGVHDIWLRVPEQWGRYLFAKGFVAVNGSSLTVGACESEEDAEPRFSLHLIPETLRLTALGTKQAGDRLNIELDAQTVTIVDTVERVLAARGL